MKPVVSRWPEATLHKEAAAPCGTAASVLGRFDASVARQAVDPATALDLIGGDVEPSFFLSAPAKAPRTVCGCHSSASTISSIVAPPSERSISISFACFVPVRGVRALGAVSASAGTSFGASALGASSMPVGALSLPTGSTQMAARPGSNGVERSVTYHRAHPDRLLAVIRGFEEHCAQQQGHGPRRFALGTGGVR